MQSLDDIKLRLSSFIKKKLDVSHASAIHFYEQAGDCCYAMIQADDTREISYGISSDGFSFSSLHKPLQDNPYISELEHQAPVIDESAVSTTGYCGDRHIHLMKTDKHKMWVCDRKSLIHSTHPIQSVAAWRYPAGNLVLYYEKQIMKGRMQYEAHIALFDHQHPDELLWRTSMPLWRSNDQWPNTVAEPVGAVRVNEEIIMYWKINESVLYGVKLSGFPYDPSHFVKPHLKIQRHVANPMIAPNKHNSWEAFTTMNPAALLADGHVHILYRAQGYDYISSVGYARSRNGYTIDKRFDRPAYAPHEQFEVNRTGSAHIQYVSGGGYGGCEDPRVTLVGNKVYMVYVAYDGYTPPRLALTSILLTDFLKQRWNWAKPVLISPPGIVDKSGCLLSEKIDGKYVIFHRIFPDILIDYVDDLTFDGKTKFLRGQYRISPRPDMWDSRKIGVGAPPLRTKDGWLVIYYGVDDRDASKYHLGAMLLDLKHPERVLYRSDDPILSPTERYETEGFKPGIAYPCGAVIMNKNILVYYGGADNVVCVAEADLEEFLYDLTHDTVPRLHEIRVSELTTL